eukprot:13865945-Ditylum_brightwellii.AAC.1
MEESEDTKVNNAEMEQWQINFNAEQKRHVKDKEKQIPKKIDAMMNNLMTAMGTNFKLIRII